MRLPGGFCKSLVRAACYLRTSSLQAATLEVYAESHPRPLQVNQAQAAQMLNKSHVTVRKMIRAGLIRLNACGDIPISEIGRILAATGAD